MRPIAFMRLRQLDVPEDILKKYKPSQIVVEQKFDGFKVMATRGRRGTTLYSRNGKDLTAKAPQIVKALNKLLKPGDTVLGEIVYVHKGQQELGLVQSVLHSKTAARAIRKNKELGGKLQYVVYDVLEMGGQDIAPFTFSVRRKKLETLVPSRGDVRKSKLYTWGQRKVAMKRAISAGGEGIVVKVKESPYTYRKAGQSEPHGMWWKHKVPGEKAHTEDVILLGYAKREKRLAFKMYQIDAGKRAFVGYVSNLPRETESDVQKMSDRGKPVVAEISHQERFPSGKFRHPGWIRLRPDKPVKSATMTRRRRGKITRNPMAVRAPKQKNHSVFLVAERRETAVVYAFDSKDHMLPALAAKECMLALEGSGQCESAHVFTGEKELGKFLRKRDVPLRPGKRSTLKSNPRPSKVKDALAMEATRFKKFEEFSASYWEDCSRGIYWYATNEKRFHIGDHEKKLIADGKFFVACNPELALGGKNKDKKYVAELDVTRLPPSAISVKRGSGGSEVKIVSGGGGIKITRVLESSKAKRSLKWQLSILPSSKEGLRRFWEQAWEKKRKESAKIAIRAKKKAEREERRKEARDREEARAREREEKAAARREKAAKESRRKAGEAALRAKRARRTAAQEEEIAGLRRKKAAKKASKKAAEKRAKAEERARKKAAKKTAKKASKKKAKKKAKKKTKTKWRRARPEEISANPSSPVRKIPSHVNNPGC